MALPPAKFAIGDLVSHTQTPALRFRVVAILESVDDGSPEPPYLYQCDQLLISPVKRNLKYDDSVLKKVGQLSLEDADGL